MAEQRFDELLAKYLAGELGPEKEEEIQQLLEADPSLLAELGEQRFMDTILKIRHNSHKAADWAQVKKQLSREEIPGKAAAPPAISITLIRTGIAASILLAGIISFFVYDKIVKSSGPGKIIVAGACSGDFFVVGEKGPAGVTPGQKYRLGSRFKASDGSTGQLHLDGSKVKIVMLENTEITVTGGEEQEEKEAEGFIVDLHRGIIESDIRVKGTPFTVSTPAGTASALGTRYSVELLTTPKEKEMQGLAKVAGAVMLVTVFSGTVDIANPFGSYIAAAGSEVLCSSRTEPVSFTRKTEANKAADKTEVLCLSESRTEPVSFTRKTEANKAADKTEVLDPYLYYPKIGAQAAGIFQELKDDGSFTVAVAQANGNTEDMTFTADPRRGVGVILASGEKGTLADLFAGIKVLVFYQKSHVGYIAYRVEDKVAVLERIKMRKESSRHREGKPGTPVLMRSRREKISR